MRQVREVDPGELRLPPERPDGPDPFKLLDQYREFGDSMVGMPPLWVMEGADGEYLIVDMNTETRRELLEALEALGRQYPEMRLGQRLLFVTRLARGPAVSVVYEMDDGALLRAARSALGEAAMPRI